MGHPQKQIQRFWLRQNDEQEQTKTNIPGIRSETCGTHRTITPTYDDEAVMDGARVVGERLFADEFIDGPGGELGDVGAADVGPAVAALEGASADEDGAGG